MMVTVEKRNSSEVFHIQLNENVNFSEEQLSQNSHQVKELNSYRENDDSLAWSEKKKNKIDKRRNEVAPTASPQFNEAENITSKKNKSHSYTNCRLKWKWFVFAASFYSILCSAGFPYCLSVLFVELLDEFQRTKAETSLVQSVCLGLFLCSGFISGSMVNKFGEQKCLLLGTLLSAFGVGIAYFAMNIPFLICSVGLLGGTGFSLCYISSYSIAPLYFTGRWRFLAIGFLSLSSGVGQLILPVILNVLIQIYHWRGALLIISGLLMNMLVSTLIIVKPKTKTEKVNFKQTKLSNGEIGLKSSGVSKERTTPNPPTNSYELSSKSSTTLYSRFRKLATNKTFVGFTIAMMISFSSINNIAFFFIDLYEYKGITRSTGVWLYTATGLASTIVRPFPGYLAQNPRIPKLAIPAVHILMGAIDAILFPFATTLTHFAILSCVFGMSIGGIVSVLSISTLHIVGEEDYPTALGVIFSAIGVITITSGPISGYLRDATGTYDYSFFAVGAGLFLSFLLLLTMLVCSTDKHKSKMLEFVIEVRRISRRHSSLLPWKKSIELTIQENTKL